MRAMTIAASAALALVVVGGSATQGAQEDEYAVAKTMPAAVHVINGLLTDAKGMSLYTWDSDKEANKSVCTGNCLNNWPVFKAEASDKDMGDWKVITRDDGLKQWAYKGKPFYYFVMDKAPGDKLGDGRGMVWHIAKQ